MDLKSFFIGMLIGMLVDVPFFLLFAWFVKKSNEYCPKCNVVVSPQAWRCGACGFKLGEM